MAARTAALLIDDDARLGALVTEYLGQHGVEVTAVGDGKRGLAALKSGRLGDRLRRARGHGPGAAGAAHALRVRAPGDAGPDRRPRAVAGAASGCAQGRRVRDVRPLGRRPRLEAAGQDRAERQRATLHQDRARRGLRPDARRTLRWPGSTRGSTSTRSWCWWSRA